MTVETTEPGVFVDRRKYDAPTLQPAMERRQFTNSHDGLSPDARELALNLLRTESAVAVHLDR